MTSLRVMNLGFLHSIQYGKPSLVCDFQELFRYFIDDFLIQYCQSLKLKYFIAKTEDSTKNKKGKRVYLNDIQTGDLTKKLNEFFKFRIEVPRIRVGTQQTIEILINEDALFFVKFLRNEIKTWVQRNAIL